MRSLNRALALCALLAAPLVAFVAAPLSGECVVKRLAGFACPGCGLGHAVEALARFELAEAVRHYPPLPLLAVAWLVALLATARWVAAAWRRERLDSSTRSFAALGRVGALVGVCCAGMVICNWIVALCA